MMDKIKTIVPQSAKKLLYLPVSLFYNAVYGFPSRKLKVIGVTGTDGKTTTSNMLYEIFTEAGKNTGLITSINAKFGKEELPTGFHVTTPDPKPLQEFLRKMVKAGIEYVVLESTSHGLHQHRLAGIMYEAGVFTNVTHEHLDYHKTYEEYLAAKAKLIKKTKKSGFIVLNHDDSSFEKLASVAKTAGVKVKSYGIENEADYMAKNIEEGKEGTEFEVECDGKAIKVQLPIPGLYNIYNALAAISVAAEMGISGKAIVAALSEFIYLEGRWEVIQEKPFKVVVDFAHTPNALERVLENARSQIESASKLIVVYGCAGERDFNKRPMMGEISGRLADMTIMTAEDPRTESLEKINEQIEKGIMKNEGKQEGRDYLSIHDRREAIRRAIELARPGDIVVITGKGHEKSMNLDGKTEIPWSDQEVVKEILGEILPKKLPQEENT